MRVVLKPLLVFHIESSTQGSRVVYLARESAAVSTDCFIRGLPRFAHASLKSELQCAHEKPPKLRKRRSG